MSTDEPTPAAPPSDPAKAETEEGPTPHPADQPAAAELEAAEPAPLPPSEVLPLRRDVIGEAEALLARAAEARGGEPVATSLPRGPADPYDAAREVLQRAAAARGVAPDPDPFPVDRRGPLEAAEDALARARDAQAHARAGGSRGLQREAEARAQLDQLKGLRGSPRSDDDDDEPAPPTPRKRTL